ncbi:MAG TPA: hypothetical protein VHW24_24305 [Bryobacteraceae bacterium]|nr:hypothetical protein [Bryobacteraceae bacterium]
MRWLSPVLATLLSLPLAPAMEAQDAAPKLNIVIVEGEGAINNIRQRTAREPIVRVEDENHRPVAGAAVVFALADQGAGGSFAGGSHTLTAVTDNQGRAIARGFRPNNVQGQYQIHVTASQNGVTATANIAESNVLAAGAAGTVAAAGISAKLIAAIVVVAAAAAAGGAYAATHSGGGGNGAANPSVITITPGNGTVGPPK